MNVSVCVTRQRMDKREPKGEKENFTDVFLSDNKQHKPGQNPLRVESRKKKRGTWRGTIDEGISRGRAEKKRKAEQNTTAGLWRSSSSSFPFFYISFSILLYGMIVVRLWSLCISPKGNWRRRTRPMYKSSSSSSSTTTYKKNKKKKTTKRGRE